MERKRGDRNDNTGFTDTWRKRRDQGRRRRRRAAASSAGYGPDAEDFRASGKSCTDGRSDGAYAARIPADAAQRRRSQDRGG